jgi:hypothetical protein
MCVLRFNSEDEQKNNLTHTFLQAPFSSFQVAHHQKQI